MAEAYISIGSNIGDRDLNLLRAVAEVGGLRDTRVTALSSFFETEPVGYREQPEFLNAVLRVETLLPPLNLLRELQRIENDIFRRVRDVAGGPRTIDLDILLYDELVVDRAELQIPHPRMQDRRFVLEPLAEIAPAVTHPVLLRTARELLADLVARGAAQRVKRVE